MSAAVSLLGSGSLPHLAAKRQIYPTETLGVEENLPWPMFALEKPTNHHFEQEPRRLGKQPISKG